MSAGVLRLWHAGRDAFVPQTTPWAYVEHHFILLEPPANDKKLTHYFSKSEGFLSFASVENMEIAWPVLAVRVAVIILVAFGSPCSYATMRVRDLPALFRTGRPRISAGRSPALGWLARRRPGRILDRIAVVEARMHPPDHHAPAIDADPAVVPPRQIVGGELVVTMEDAHAVIEPAAALVRVVGALRAQTALEIRIFMATSLFVLSGAGTA